MGAKGKNLSRRAFLKAAGAAGVGSLLTATGALAGKPGELAQRKAGHLGGDEAVELGVGTRLARAPLEVEANNVYLSSCLPLHLHLNRILAAGSSERSHVHASPGTVIKCVLYESAQQQNC